MNWVIENVRGAQDQQVFGADGAHRALRLADSQVTSTGAIIATYAAAGG